MLEFKKEYFQTENNRTLYPTSMNIANCDVFGCKPREAFMYKIPNERYSSNGGNIDFSKYPNGVWTDYTAIKIVERLPLFQPSVNFNKLGDITPSNLNKLKDEIKQHIVDLEKAISTTHIFIDSGNAGQNNLPYLPNDSVWFRNGATGNIEALPIGEMYDRFEQMLNTLYTEIKKLLLIDKDNMKEELRKLTEELKKALNDLKALLDEQFKEEADRYTGEKKEELNTHVDEVNKPELQKYTNEKKDELLHFIVENHDKLKGEKGDRGASIAHIVPKETAPNGSNVYTVITDEDEAIGDITAPIGPRGDSIVGQQGDKGEKGDKGTGIESISFVERNAEGNKYNVNLDDGTLGGTIVAPKGDTGAKGDKGDIGNTGEQGIQGIGFKSFGFVETTQEGNKYNVNLDNGTTSGTIIAPKGDKGDTGTKGDKGDKGDTGNTGAIVETSGLYCFTVKNDGCLYLSYQGNERPNFVIDEDGNLIYSTDPYFPQQKKLIINLTKDSFKNNIVGDVKLYNGNDLLTTFGENKNSGYTENDLCYNSQDGYFFIGRNKESIYIDIKELDLFNTTKKLTVEFQFSQTDIANNWSNPLFLTSMEDFIHDAGDVNYRTTSGIRLEYSNINGSLDFYPSPYSEGTDGSIKSIGTVNNLKHSVIITLENTKVIVYFDYVKVGECNIREIPKINYIGLNKTHGTHRCCNMKIYGLKVWKDTVLTDEEIEYIKNSEVM